MAQTNERLKEIGKKQDNPLRNSYGVYVIQSVKLPCHLIDLRHWHTDHISMVNTAVTPEITGLLENFIKLLGFMQ